MLRSIFNPIFGNEAVQFLPVQYQIKRWKRKPRKPFWLGTAKSKKFVVREDPLLDPEEKAEMLRLHANYKSAIRSIKHYFETSIPEQIQATEIVTREEIEESVKRNLEWNAECAARREERLKKSDADHELLVLTALDKISTRNRLIQERVDELVRLEKENSKDFVTRENLDAKIEECLSNLVDYNFAIDLQGNRYRGYDQQMVNDGPGEIPEKKEEKLGFLKTYYL